MNKEFLLDSASNIVKDAYLPLFNNQIGTEADPFLAKIKKVPLESNKIVAVAPVGLSGGYGFGAEGEETPSSGALGYDRFETTSKDMYVELAISVKSMRLSGDKKAFVNAVDSEVRSAYQTAEWNTARALYGDGTGKLATVTALTDAGNEIKVDDTRFLKEGLTIDIYAKDGTSPQAVSGTCTGGKARRIVAIDRVNNKITIDGDPSTFAEGFITLQNSYGREFTGLGSIFYDNITTLYGLSKSTHPHLNPITKDCGEDISDSVITNVLRQSANFKGGDVDTLLCGDGAYDAYVEYLRQNNYRVESMTHEITGGFKAIKFQFGTKEVDLVNRSFVPNTEIWGVDSKVCEFHSTGWDFANEGGSKFTLKEKQSIYRALLANYAEFICKKPGGCIRLTNCVPSVLAQ